MISGAIFDIIGKSQIEFHFFVYFGFFIHEPLPSFSHGKPHLHRFQVGKSKVEI